MIQGKNKTVQDYIIELLARGSSNINDIHTYIQNYRTVTRPAIYDQLRKLRDDGIVLKNKTQYVLSREWIDSVSQLFTSFDAPILQEGERVTYTFKTLDQADAYWKHIFPLYDSLYENMPICIYNKHCFWVHLLQRKQSEERHYNSYKQQKRTAYFVIGDTTELDMTFKKKYHNSFFKINTHSISAIHDIDNVTIVGDIIINSQLPASFIKKIHSVYHDDKLSIEEKISQINQLGMNIGAIKFKIERNRNRATQLKKIITKEFVVPQKHKEKLYL